MTTCTAPGTLTATKVSNGAAQFSRPLCRYPQYPRYTGPANDAAALGQTLTQLLTDPELGRRLGSAARARFEAHFTLDKVCQQVVDLLRHLAEGRQLRQVNAALGQREALGAPLTEYKPPDSLQIV